MKKVQILLLLVSALTLAAPSPAWGSGGQPYSYFFVRAEVPSLEGGVMVVEIGPDPSLPGYWPDPVGVGWTLPANRRVIHIHRGDRGASVPDLRLGDTITLSKDWEGESVVVHLVVEGESYIPYSEEDRENQRVTVEAYPQVYSEQVAGGPLWVLVTCHPDGANPTGMVVKYLLKLE